MCRIGLSTCLSEIQFCDRTILGYLCRVLRSNDPNAQGIVLYFEFLDRAYEGQAKKNSGSLPVYGVWSTVEWLWSGRDDTNLL